jgi:hypothetical protein
MGQGQSYECGNTCTPLKSDTIFDYSRFTVLGNLIQNPSPGGILTSSPDSCGEVKTNMGGRSCAATTIELVCMLEEEEKPEEIDICPGAFISVSDFEETELTEGLSDSKDEYVIQDYVYLDMTGVKKINCDEDFPCTFTRGYDDSASCPFFTVDASKELKIKNAQFFDFRPDEFFENIRNLFSGDLGDENFLFSDEPSQFACVNDMISDQGVFDYIEIEGLKFPKASKSGGSRRGLGRNIEGGKKNSGKKRYGKRMMTNAQHVEIEQQLLAMNGEAPSPAKKSDSDIVRDLEPEDPYAAMIASFLACMDADGDGLVSFEEGLSFKSCDANITIPAGALA